MRLTLNRNIRLVISANCDGSYTVSGDWIDFTVRMGQSGYRECIALCGGSRDHIFVESLEELYDQFTDVSMSRLFTGLAYSPCL